MWGRKYQRRSRDLDAARAISQGVPAQQLAVINDNSRIRVVVERLELMMGRETRS